MAPVVSKPLKADTKAFLRTFYTRLSYQPKCEAHSLNILKFLARSGEKKEKATSPAYTDASTALLTPRGEETVSLRAAACWTRTYAEEAAPKPTRPTMCRERHCSTGYLAGLCAELEPAVLDLRIPEDKQAYIRSFYKDLQDGQAMVVPPHIRDADKWPQAQERASSPDGDVSDPQLTAGPALTRGITCDAQQREASDPMQPRMRRERRRSSEYLASLCPSVPAALAEWPEAVHELLGRSNDFRLRTWPKDPESELLKFQSGAFSMPHAGKVDGGEDSHFMGANLRCLGVADGVGEWSCFGLSARNFANELMLGCQEYFMTNNPGDIAGDLREHVLEALKKAHQQTRSWGSSTAVVTALGRRGQLGIANLGDSALAVLRREEVGGGMTCICRTEDQQVKFNLPWQLACYPGPADYPQLMREGEEKQKLVKALQQSRRRKDHGPEDSQLLSCQVQEGDMLILGTDGMWDNLYMEEVCQIVAGAVGPLEEENGHFTEAAQIAEALAKAARWRSLSRDARTPFSDAARKAGVKYEGGKMDDVTCVCAWVTSDRK
ncbi:unnamed protein product [Symbiodinium natans]|uniref:Protein phosphatase n=1 Tax=Symbiodinium natans TaxID=878477 RepID=A0A812JE38_9DINO|nr:unnamed protein product [Symbiodinium natans]